MSTLKEDKKVGKWKRNWVLVLLVQRQVQTWIEVAGFEAHCCLARGFTCMKLFSFISLLREMSAQTSTAILELYPSYCIMLLLGTVGSLWKYCIVHSVANTSPYATLEHPWILSSLEVCASGHLKSKLYYSSQFTRTPQTLEFFNLHIFCSGVESDQ